MPLDRECLASSISLAYIHINMSIQQAQSTALLITAEAARTVWRFYVTASNFFMTRQQPQIPCHACTMMRMLPSSLCLQATAETQIASSSNNLLLELWLKNTKRNSHLQRTGKPTHLSHSVSNSHDLSRSRTRNIYFSNIFWRKVDNPSWLPGQPSFSETFYAFYAFYAWWFYFP